MPYGWPTPQYQKLLLARQRYVSGDLNEQTPESLHLAFAKYLCQTARCTEWPLDAALREVEWKSET